MPEASAVDRFIEAFWKAETTMGYEVALKVIGEQFGLSPSDAELLLTDDDALDNGNFVVTKPR